MYARRNIYNYGICALYRSFAVRRIRDGFRANKSLQDAGEIKTAYDKAQKSYEMLKRQVRTVDNLVAMCQMVTSIYKRKKISPYELLFDSHVTSN